MVFAVALIVFRKEDFLFILMMLECALHFYYKAAWLECKENIGRYFPFHRTKNEGQKQQHSVKSSYSEICFKIHGKTMRESFLNAGAEFRPETLLINRLSQMHFLGIFILLFRRATFENTSENCNLNLMLLTT